VSETLTASMEERVSGPPAHAETPATAAGLDYKSLTAARLAEMVREQGIDLATTHFYQCICRTEPHRSFLRQLDALENNSWGAGPHKYKILVAPAAFYKEHPKFGGDGRIIHEVARECGISSSTIPVPSTGSVSRNAKMIARQLAGEAEGSIILASLSKGGADVRIALEQQPEIASKVRVWLNICGLVRGTSISDSLLGTRWWQRGLLRGYLAYTRADVDFVSELSGSPGSLLGGAPRIPPIPVINVVAFPLREHLSKNSAIRHARMASLGPNDGSTLLRDAIIEPGTICPVWGADHFLRGPEVPALLKRLLLYAEECL
jgi:hypothetical protein